MKKHWSVCHIAEIADDYIIEFNLDIICETESWSQEMMMLLLALLELMDTTMATSWSATDEAMELAWNASLSSI